jgi:hypothetical protein
MKLTRPVQSGTCAILASLGVQWVAWQLALRIERLLVLVFTMFVVVVALGFAEIVGGRRSVGVGLLVGQGVFWLALGLWR